MALKKDTAKVAKVLEWFYADENLVEMYEKGMYIPYRSSVVGIRMGDGNRAQRGGTPGKVNGSIQLRRDVHDSHKAPTAVVQRLKRREIGRFQIRRVLCALFLF